MEVFDSFLDGSWKCRIPIKFREKATTYNVNHKAEHSASDNGMEVEQNVILLALNEAVWNHKPKDEEVGEEEHAQPIDHVRYVCDTAVLELRQQDADVGQDRPGQNLPVLMHVNLVVCWSR